MRGQAVGESKWRNQRDILPQMSRSLHVAIVVYRSDGAWLRRTLTSLCAAIDTAHAAGRLAEAHIDIVDNAATDSDNSTRDTVEALKAEVASPSAIPKAVRYVPMPANLGYGAANNRALKDTTADFVLVLNPDVETGRDAIAHGIAWLDAHESVAMVTPVATYPDGTPQFLVKRMPNVLALALRGFAPHWLKARFATTLAHYEMRDLAFDAPLTDCRIVSGCWMLMRGTAWRGSGGFDEKFFLYFEDFDLSARIAATAAIHRVPGCRIVHAGGNAADKGARHIGMFMRSAGRFFAKHGWRWV